MMVIVEIKKTLANGKTMCAVCEEPILQGTEQIEIYTVFITKQVCIQHLKDMLKEPIS